MQSPINEVDAIAAAGIEAALESPTVFQGVEDPIGDHNEDKYDDQNNKIIERLMPVATTVWVLHSPICAPPLFFSRRARH
jgi:hypothetical protein